MQERSILITVVSLIGLSLLFLGGIIYMYNSKQQSPTAQHTNNISSVPSPNSPQTIQYTDTVREAMINPDNKGVIIFENGKFEQDTVTFKMENNESILISVINNDLNPVTFIVIQKPENGLLSNRFVLNNGSFEGLNFKKTGEYKLQANQTDNIITINIL